MTGKNELPLTEINNTFYPTKDPTAMSDVEIRQIWEACYDYETLKERAPNDFSTPTWAYDCGDLIEGGHYTPEIVVFDGYIDSVTTIPMLGNNKTTQEYNPFYSSMPIRKDHATLYLVIMPYQRLISRHWQKFKNSFENWPGIIEAQEEIYIPQAMEITKNLWEGITSFVNDSEAKNNV